MRPKKEINIRIGKNIQFAREKAGYTQEELSELLEMTPNHLGAIERGASGATLETIEKLCHLFGISSDILLFGYSSQQDAWSNEIGIRANNIPPRFRPQVEKVFAALLEMSHAQEQEKD